MSPGPRWPGQRASRSAVRSCGSPPRRARPGSWAAAAGCGDGFPASVATAVGPERRLGHRRGRRGRLEVAPPSARSPEAGPPSRHRRARPRPRPHRGPRRLAGGRRLPRRSGAGRGAGIRDGHRGRPLVRRRRHRADVLPRLGLAGLVPRRARARSATSAWSGPRDGGRDVVDVTPMRFNDHDPVFTLDGRYPGLPVGPDLRPRLRQPRLRPLLPGRHPPVPGGAGRRRRRPRSTPSWGAAATDDRRTSGAKGRRRSDGEEKGTTAGRGTRRERWSTEHLAERVVAVPVAAARYTQLRAAPAGWCGSTSRWSECSATSRPVRAPSGPRRPSSATTSTSAAQLTLLDTAESIAVTGDGKSLVVRDGRALVVVPSTARVEPTGADPTARRSRRGGHRPGAVVRSIRTSSGARCTTRRPASCATTSGSRTWPTSSGTRWSSVTGRCSPASRPAATSPSCSGRSRVSSAPPMPTRPRRAAPSTSFAASGCWAPT